MASPEFETYGNGEQGNPSMGTGEGKTSLPDLSKRVIKVLVSLFVPLKMWGPGISIFF